MGFSTVGWERGLMNLAAAGARTAEAQGPRSEVAVDLRAAFARASEITRQHSKSFHAASSLMRRDLRRDIRALYAFCRLTDDIVDLAEPSHARRLLTGWQAGCGNVLGEDGVMVLAAWDEVRRRHGIPTGYADQLIEGVGMDLSPTYYDTFDDLAHYAYRVASTVGLMSMHVVGFESAEAVPYAVKMGVALQLTNILRDVAEDLGRGRLYLPMDEIADFGLTIAQLEAGRVTPAWRRYARFWIDRNRRLYQEAWPGIGLLAKPARLAVGAAAELYAAILEEIEALDYDIFRHRAHLGRIGKLKRLPGIWMKTRSSGASASKLGRRARQEELSGEVPKFSDPGGGSTWFETARPTEG